MIKKIRTKRKENLWEAMLLSNSKLLNPFTNLRLRTKKPNTQSNILQITKNSLRYFIDRKLSNLLLKSKQRVLKPQYQLLVKFLSLHNKKRAQRLKLTSSIHQLNRLSLLRSIRGIFLKKKRKALKPHLISTFI